MRGENMADIWVVNRPRDVAAMWSRVGVRGLSKCVGRRSVLCNLNFSIEDGEILGLVGQHGSTVLDLLAGESAPTFGRITFSGADVTQLGSDDRRNLGMMRVLRPSELVAEMTALENVALRAGVRVPFYPRRGGPNSRDAASAMLGSIGLADRRDTRVSRLSAYEQCLLTLAIALAAEPSLLLLDGIPDGLTRVEHLRFGALIADIRFDRGLSVLIAERDISSPLQFCDRILLLRRGQIVADDVPSRMAEHLQSRRGAAIAGLSQASDPLQL
jgi:branched-chain amino acid transport system ATP-binding protein